MCRGAGCSFVYEQYETHNPIKRPPGWRKGDPKSNLQLKSLERHLEVIEALRPFRAAARRGVGIVGHVDLEML